MSGFSNQLVVLASACVENMRERMIHYFIAPSVKCIYSKRSLSQVLPLSQVKVYLTILKSHVIYTKRLISYSNRAKYIPLLCSPIFFGLFCFGGGGIV